MNELRQALELATEEELQDLTDLLFRRKYNPLDYLREPTPGQVQATNRQEWLAAIENRFRFVAADGFTVLKGQTETLNYRQILVQVSRHLKIQYSPTLSTTDLEAEIYLHLIKEAWQKLPKNQQEQLRQRIQTALADTPGTPLPVNCQTDPRRWLLEGSSALAVSSCCAPCC